MFGGAAGGVAGADVSGTSLSAPAAAGLPLPRLPKEPRGETLLSMLLRHRDPGDSKDGWRKKAGMAAIAILSLPPLPLPLPSAGSGAAAGEGGADDRDRDTVSAPAAMPRRSRRLTERGADRA